MTSFVKRLLTLGLVSSTVLTSFSSFAAPNDAPRGPDGFSDRSYEQPRNTPNQPQRDFQPRDRDRGLEARRPQGGPSYAQEGPRSNNAQWRKGQYVPKQYRSSHYYVNDWKRQQLPTPPRGHRWLNVNGDYILVAIATGVISSILLNQH